MATISDLKDAVQRKVHGTSLDSVPSIEGVIAEAGAQIIALIDPVETMREVSITNGLYDDIYDYTAPADLKGNKIVEIRRQVNRTSADNFAQRMSVEFSSNRHNNTFQVKHINGTKSVSISKNVSSDVVTIHQMNDITTNGTWAVGGDATNITKDTQYYVKGGASLNFDLNGSGTTGYIENATMKQVNLSDHDEKSSIFLRVYIPDQTAITNCILRWGNDTSNYWSKTVTTSHEGGAFENGWNILRFDWNGATETGTVASATLDYVRLTVTYNGTAETDIRVDHIVSALPEIYYMTYYSKYLFKSSAGTYLETPTDDRDTINLDTDSYPILIYQTCYLLAQELQGEDSGFDIQFFAAEKQRLINEYIRNNPSQSIRPQSFYYRV